MESQSCFDLHFPDDKVVEQEKYSYTAGGGQTCTTTLEVNLEVAQKIGNSSTSRPSYTTLSMYPEDVPPSHKDICSTMLSSFIHNNLTAPLLTRAPVPAANYREL